MAMVGKPRAAGATAVLARLGQPQVTTVTGGAIEVVTRPSEPGFSPLDLLYASLASCLALSARIAASDRGVLAALTAVRVTVTGDKVADQPSRIGRFHVEIAVDGDLDEATKRTIIADAEAICTVSNTLRGQPAL